MMDDYTKRLSGIGRRAAFVLALACGVIGLWLMLSPGSVRTTLLNAGAWWDAGKAGSISLGTGIKDGGYYRIGSELAEAIHASGPYTVEVRETTGSLDNLTQIAGGQLGFGLVQGGLLGNSAVVEGAAATGHVMPVANVDKQYLHLVVPVDSPVQSLRDLAGARLGVGPQGSGHEALARLLFGYFAASSAPALVADHSPNLEQAFRDGQIDAALAVYSLFAPAMEDLLKTGWYRLVPIMEADALSRYLPGVYAATLPPDLYGPDRSIPPATFGPFPTLMVNTFLVARSDVPDAQVRAVLEGLYSAGFRYDTRLAELDEAQGRNSPLVPLHPAAAAWYARKEPLSTDRFEVASFFLAGVVTLAAFTQYLVGRRYWLRGLRSRRAIRPYFERMLEHGAAVEATSDTTALGDIIHEMMAAQREAETQWLEGKLTTEHMENLYLIYNTRSRNAFDKILQLHLQALLEGGPSPAMYHPEPARPVFNNVPFHDIFERDAAPESEPARALPVPVVREARTEPAPPEPAPTPPAPTPPSAISAPRARGKKNRGNRQQEAPPAPAPRPVAAPAPQAVAKPQPAPPAPVVAAAPQQPPPAQPAPRQLSDWEIEQKYQRSDDYAAGDFESGIVSPPRPRRVQTPQDGIAPARADLTEDPDDKRPQLDLF